MANLPGADFLTYFSAREHPAYALSIRGHGSSYKPSYWRMVYWTTAYMLAQDVAVGVKHAKREHEQDPVLMRHLNEGGCCQIVASEGLMKMTGLVLLARTPCFEG